MLYLLGSCFPAFLTFWFILYVDNIFCEPRTIKNGREETERLWGKDD